MYETTVFLGTTMAEDFTRGLVFVLVYFVWYTWRVVSARDPAIVAFETILHEADLHEKSPVLAATITSHLGLGDTAETRAQEMLRRVCEDQKAGLALGRTIGTGGMGIVRMARQGDLGRDVAVKMLRPDREKSEAAMVAMLREAWVTGTLEHPNVVPIHYVDTDEEGKPQIVLKRIEGVVWTELIADADAVQKKYGASDLLDWNLSVLAKVINTIRYAHGRGILHRDLKPDNVMVGAFGEVYLLDWGIAVSLEDDGETLLPVVGSMKAELVGTPAYMAPEMLHGVELDERTDVYLLGSVLFHILSGYGPHIGKSIETLVASIRALAPAFPEGTSDELAAICRRAMAADPDDRFATANDFAQALQDYRTHHTSLCLSKRAHIVLDGLRSKAKEGHSSQALQKTLGQCQFGFQTSLEAWPENPDAKHGLRDAIEVVAEVELSRGDPRIAQRMLSELEEPCAELVHDAEVAVQALDTSEAEMAELGKQMNTDLGKGTRLALLIAFGSSWAWVEVWAYFAGSAANVSNQLMITTSTIYLVVFLGLIFLGRKSVTSTLANRRVAVGAPLMLGHQILACIAGELLGIDSEHVFVIWILIWSTAIWMLVIVVDRRFWPTALAIGLGFLVTSAFPDLRFFSLLGFTLVLIGNGFVLWMPKTPKKG